MIELYYKNKELNKIASINEILWNEQDLFNVRVIDFTEEEVNKISNKFGLDTKIFNQIEDIEISSHYLKSDDQVSFNFSIPNYNSTDLFTDEPMVIIIKNEVVFYFLSAKIDSNFLNLSRTQYDSVSINFNSHIEHFLFQLGIISDYYADLTELIASEIKKLYESLVKSKSFKADDLDLIMKLNFNNHKIRESISSFQRILNLLIRSKFEKKRIKEKLNLEIEDVAVVKDHIQYNFERLDDLKENIASKIDLEQNKIFRTLTILTVCISLPTLIAGIYGMNFTNIPELQWNRGYPLALGLMLTSFLLAILYFKKKKWIK